MSSNPTDWQEDPSIATVWNLPPYSGDFLLLESGEFLLLETGDLIIL